MARSPGERGAALRYTARLPMAKITEEAMPTAKITRTHYRCGRISCSLRETQRGIYPKTQAARTRPLPTADRQPKVVCVDEVNKGRAVIIRSFELRQQL